MTHKTSVTIKDKHKRFYDDTKINLSKVLQDALDEKIEQFDWEDSEKPEENSSEGKSSS